MKLLNMKIEDLEDKILAEIAADELFKHTETISQWVRLSGSSDEAQAFDYIKGVLQGYGAHIEMVEFDSLIGLPEEASLEIVTPELKSFNCITHSLVPSTPPAGIEAELVYVAQGNRAAYESAAEVKGRVVLIEGLGSPQRARLAEDRGAIAQIFINDDNTREFAVSTVWGTPTPETANLLQTTPCISVKGDVADCLKEMLGQGQVRVRMKSRTWKGWRKIPVLTAEIKGAKDSNQFVLFSGHVDSWHYGAMDNAGANATMLEITRVLSGYASQMRRGLRVAFWSGHSHGRYSGSTWYADNFWEDLHDNCVAHVNIDSTGGKNATLLGEAETMAETHTFAAGVIKQRTGQLLEETRMGRLGDQSFFGCGVPSIFVSLSMQPHDARRGGFGGALGWWWHTTEDTVDKLDKDNLLRDARVYGQIIARLCTLPILPFDHKATGNEFCNIIGSFQEKAKGVFDLADCMKRAKLLKEEATLLGRAINRILQNRGAMSEEQQENAFAAANGAIMELSRILIPINYTSVDPFDQDLAVPIRPIPLLWPITELVSLNPESDAFHFLHTRLTRETNKVCHALRKAAGKAREARIGLEAFFS